ncbi:MAG: DUF1269 domain-containing protein [Betaproteobacteria bacterium]|nr:DUF1269 domain-containing protein [Betaproteobacteria bacterium]
MLRRIYCLVPDVEVARRVVDDMLLARIDEKHIHVLAKRGTPLEDLPEATMRQKSDFIPAIERGVAQGGVAGLLAGLVGIALTPGAVVIAGGIILASSLAGAGIGAWVGGMIGLNVGNTRLRRFEQAIDQGELLLMVDVPLARVDDISERIRQHHPTAQVEGTEPTIPAFP